MEYAGAILADDRMERSTNPRTRARCAGGAMLARGDAATARLSISLTHGVFCNVWSAFNLPAPSFGMHAGTPKQMSSALDCKTVRMIPGARLPSRLYIRATTPETCGVACEVPAMSTAWCPGWIAVVE